MGITLGGITLGSSRDSWSSYWKKQPEVLFFAEVKNIVDGKLYNKKNGSSDYLTVTGAAGSYTFQCPNTAAYIAADTDYIWFDSEEVQRDETTEAELIGYDFTRTIIKYGSLSPYTLDAIMILSSDFDTAKMRNDFALSVWWDNTLSAYGEPKGNRDTGKSEWTGLLPYETVLQDGNTKGWYVFDDMDTITKDGSDLVSLWKDKLSSGNDLANTLLGRPTWTANGVLFNGTYNYLEKGFTWDQPAFIYIVVKQVTWVRYSRIFGSYSTNISYLWQDDVTPKLAAFAGTASNKSGDLAVDTWGIVRVLYNGENSKFQINTETAITGNFGTAAMNGFTLGARGGGGNPSNIQVKEVILRKVADASADEAVLYAYLKDKYSL